jgi:hypothetical protein
MLQQLKDKVDARIKAITLVTYVALMSAATFALGADPATAATTYKVPCNSTLEKPASAVIDPIIGAFIGLRPIFFGLALAAFLVGAVCAIAQFGKSLVAWAGVVGAALLGFSILATFGANLGLASGC